MDLLLVIAGAALIWAIFAHSKSEESNIKTIGSQDDTLALDGYNPYILNQYVEWKDRMFSTDVEENNIYSKPMETDYGMLGLTEEKIKLNPVDAKVVVYGRENLNL